MGSAIPKFALIYPCEVARRFRLEHQISGDWELTEERNDTWSKSMFRGNTWVSNSI